MNCFLVIAREQSYEVPLAVFETRQSANWFADDVTEADVIEVVRTVWKVKPNDPPLFPESVGIVRFIDGEPQAYETVKEFVDTALSL
jgi:hypothetical protein